MSKKGAQLLEEALSLPLAERAELADRLLTSLDASPDRRIHELWAQEVEDRLDAFEREEIKPKGCFQVRQMSWKYAPLCAPAAFAPLQTLR